MRQAVIVAASRTAVGKAVRGKTRNARSDEMAATVIGDLMAKTADKLDPADVDDVILGCAMPEGSQGMNFARVIALRAGLPVDTPGQTVNRFCSSGLQTIALAANSIIADQAGYRDRWRRRVNVLGADDRASPQPQSTHGC